MSDYEKHKGVVKKLNMNRDEFEEYVKKYFEGNNIEFESKYYHSYIEQSLDLYPMRFVQVNGDYYEIIDERLDENDIDYMHTKRIDDNTFEYETLYWNGCCSLHDNIIKGINNTN